MEILDSENKNIQRTSEINELMDKRTSYDVQNVIASLMKTLVCNGQLSLEDAKRIFKSGEYYMH